MMPVQSLLNYQHNTCHHHRHCHLTTATTTATPPKEAALCEMKIMRDYQIDLI
jgi:hypothetical protein